MSAFLRALDTLAVAALSLALEVMAPSVPRQRAAEVTLCDQLADLGLTPAEAYAMVKAHAEAAELTDEALEAWLRGAS